MQNTATVVPPCQSQAAMGDRELIVWAWDHAAYPPTGQSAATAWIGIAQTVWWFHGPDVQVVQAAAAGGPVDIRAAAATLIAHMQVHGQRATIHLREANDLGKPAWQARAQRVESFIAGELDVPTVDLPLYFDRMRQMDRWHGKQVNNLVGNGFRSLVHECLRRWGNPDFTFTEEQSVLDLFPGITLTGRTTGAKVDVGVVDGAGRVRAILSFKWNFRHDRVSDPTNECVAYTTAIGQQRMLGARSPTDPFDYWVVTNELNGMRLNKLLSQNCPTGVVHLQPEFVRLVDGITPEVFAAINAGRLISLEEFIALTATW